MMSTIYAPLIAISIAMMFHESMISKIIGGCILTGLVVNIAIQSAIYHSKKKREQ